MVIPSPSVNNERKMGEDEGEYERKDGRKRKECGIIGNREMRRCLEKRRYQVEAGTTGGHQTERSRLSYGHLPRICKAIESLGRMAVDKMTMVGRGKDSWQSTGRRSEQSAWDSKWSPDGKKQ